MRPRLTIATIRSSQASGRPFRIDGEQVAEHLDVEWDSQVRLDHRIRRGALLALSVGVDGGCCDEPFEFSLRRRPLFPGPRGKLPCAICSSQSNGVDCSYRCSAHWPAIRAATITREGRAISICVLQFQRRSFIDRIAEGSIASLPPDRHPRENRGQGVDVVIDDHFTLSVMITMEAAHVLHASVPFQDTGIVRKSVSSRASSESFAEVSACGQQNAWTFVAGAKRAPPRPAAPQPLHSSTQHDDVVDNIS